MGYVWVLATADKVYYRFKFREGAFLKDLLSSFSGVLVSDFFTAYDSIGCHHQKCLVHLMRDINDDLHSTRSTPSCDSLQTPSAMSSRTSCLHRPMGTNRVPPSQAREAGRSHAWEVVPETVRFTEHAVHYFAKLRRLTDNLTEGSIGELLVLVSVLQTCEYTGVNAVLRFLLSGAAAIRSRWAGSRSHATVNPIRWPTQQALLPEPRRADRAHPNAGCGPRRETRTIELVSFRRVPPAKLGPARRHEWHAAIHR